MLEYSYVILLNVLKVLWGSFECIVQTSSHGNSLKTEKIIWKLNNCLYMVYLHFYWHLLMCFRAQMPSVTYLRLDGSVPPGSRHPIVNRYSIKTDIYCYFFRLSIITCNVCECVWCIECNLHVYIHTREKSKCVR